MKKILDFIYTYRAGILLLFILVYTAVIHGHNMFQYPYYESDEGTYTSQAWAVLTQGELSPYTYWYDHPPLGWLTIAGWFSILPETYLAFGNSLNTARVLMLLLSVISTAIVYVITNRLTKSALAATFAALFFTSSPLMIYFSRRVLLDNIQIVWLLASMAALLPRVLTLRHYAASGVFFACAFLTKITAVMFGFPFLYLVLMLKDKTHKGFRVSTWIGSAGIIVSFYFLFALVKGELFPPLFPWSKPHVSIWDSVIFQMSRGSNGWFFQEGSDFMNAFSEWVSRDPVIVYATIAAIVIGVVSFYFVKNTWYRFFVLASLFFTYFLIRGGLVINFYFIPLMPFVSILIGLIVYKSISFIGTHIPRVESKYHQALVTSVLMFVCTVGLLTYYNVVPEREYLTKDETKNQIAATNWIKQTLPENADIIIDSTMYVELHDPRYLNDKVFENAEWFYKISRDPDVRDKKYAGTWESFDYLGLSHEMLKQIDNFSPDDPVVLAFDNSLPIVKWFEDSSAFIDENERVSTNGDWAMVYDINSQTRNQLTDAWEYYKKNFIVSYGQVVDPSNGFTTSEGQSYAMLRAAWMNDQDTFKGVWLWTQHHLQHRIDDKLISWKWENDALADSANATDADVDIALALIFGYVTFGDEQYLEDARELITDIWDRAIVEVDDKYYLVSANIENSQVPDGLLFNPSYLSPGHYRIFADIDPDPEHNWNKAADDVYDILAELTSRSQTPLIKNWYVINPETGSIGDASPYIGFTANLFSYDAFRIFWRVWLDYAWFNNQRAENYLIRSGDYLETVALDEKPPTIIDPVTGSIISRNIALAIHSSYVLPLTLSADAAVSREYYVNNIEDYWEEEGYWAFPSVYYDQNWVWFTAAFYNNDVYNIWSFNQN